MPKTHQQKEQLVASFLDRLNRSVGVVFVGVTGVKVSQIEQIRNELFGKGLQLQIAKNTLLQRVLQEKGIEVPQEVLDQPLGLVYAYEDVVAAPKSIQALSKEIESLTVLGGIMDGRFISSNTVDSLAKLPSREQLLGQLVGTIAAPLNGLVNVLHGNIRGLVTALGQIRDAKGTTA